MLTPLPHTCRLAQNNRHWLTSGLTRLTVALQNWPCPVLISSITTLQGSLQIQSALVLQWRPIAQIPGTKRLDWFDHSIVHRSRSVRLWSYGTRFRYCIHNYFFFFWKIKHSVIWYFKMRKDVEIESILQSIIDKRKSNIPDEIARKYYFWSPAAQNQFTLS